MRLSVNNFRRAGFTFVELSIGMVVVSLVMAALAAFALATADAWKAGASTNVVGNGQTVAAIPIIATLAAVRLDNEIGTALATGGYYPGTLTTSAGQQASLMLWKSDAIPYGTIDKSEVELIEYDATDRVIYKYSPSSSTPVMTYTNFSSASWIATFKYTATKTPMVRNVDGMQIYVSNPSSLTQLPVVEYRLYFSRNGKNQTRYGAVCLRSPSTPSGMLLN